MGEDDHKQSVVSKSALTPEETKKRRQRNLAIAAGLGAFIILVFLVTILRLGASVTERAF